MPDKDQEPEEKSKPRRRWRRRLLYCFLILVGFLIWANGPGLRWGLKLVLTQQLEAQKLSGTFEVEGSALSGITLRNVSLHGECTVQSIESHLIKVEWSLGSLWNKELEVIRLDRLHVVIDPQAPLPPSSDPVEPEPEKADQEAVKLSDILGLVRGLIQPSKISITDLKVEIVGVTEASLASFTHEIDEPTYLITDFKARDHLGRPLHNPKSILTWTDECASIDQITLNSQLSLANVRFVPDETASLTLRLGKSEIFVESDLKEAHQVVLKSDSLPIPDIMAQAYPELKIEGEITAIEIDTGKGFVLLEAQELKHDDLEIAHAFITAKTPDLISPFDQPINIVAVVDEDKLKLTGAVILNRVIEDSTADLNLVVNWPGVPTVTAGVTYGYGEAHVEAKTLDRLQVSGDFDIDSLTYQAEVISQIADASILEEHLDLPVKLGALKFNSTATGNLTTNEHSGSLHLEKVGVIQPNFPEATAKGKLSWDWPKSVLVESLTMTTPETEAQVKLGWENDTLTINTIGLKEIAGDEQLLNITGKLPAPLEIESLDRFLRSEKAIALTVESQPITFEKLASFIPIPDGISGVTQANFTLGGTLAAPSLAGHLTLSDFETVDEPDLLPLSAELKLETKDQQLQLQANTEDPKGIILELESTFPFLPHAWLDLQAIPENTPIDLKICNCHLEDPAGTLEDSRGGLDLRRVQQFVPSIESLRGSAKINLILSGTLGSPELNGTIGVFDILTSLQPNFPKIDLWGSLETEDERLKVEITGTDGGAEFLSASGSVPTLRKAWMAFEDMEVDRSIDLNAKIPQFNIKRAQPFVSEIQTLRGQFSGSAKITGTINDPEISASAKLDLDQMRIKDSPVSDFKNSHLEVSLENWIAKIEKSYLIASGGRANIKGSIDLKGDEPDFDVTLSGRYISLYRNEDFTFRGHPDLKLSGLYSQARITGTLEIVESLIYKDVEILPFGVPRTTEIPRPNIPTFSKKRQKTKTLKPTPGVMDWGLDIKVTIGDPILIRGNLVKGKVIGQNLRVTGTIRDPRTSGNLIAQELEADLPFSSLEVQTGIVSLRPDSLTNPLIDLRGSSTVGQYTVQVYLSGKVQNPKLVLTSDPPLPESEIMLLLATGSASDQLSNQQVASQKAIQYLFEALRRRNGEKDDNIFQRLLKNSDQIDLSVGETNRFSGRNFSSATLKITDDWDFTTQIDEQGQTRALVIFSIRFR